MQLLALQTPNFSKQDLLDNHNRQSSHKPSDSFIDPGWNTIRLGSPGGGGRQRWRRVRSRGDGLCPGWVDSLGW